MINQKKAYFFAGLTVLCWSTIASAFKIALKFQDNFQLLMGSAFISFTILFSIIIAQGKTQKIFSCSFKEYLHSAFMGFLNPFLYYLILFKAYSILPAQVAQPLNMTWPVVLVLISIPLLGQKIRLKSIFALLISFAGVLMISSQGLNGNYNTEQLPGIILAIGSSIIWAFFWILNVKDPRDEIIKLFLSFFFALLFLIITIPLLDISFPSGKQAWISSAYVGCFEMGFAFIFWLKALKYSETTDKVSNLIYISPFLSLIFIHYFVGEKIFLTTIIGLILIISGILLQNKISGKREYENR